MTNTIGRKSNEHIFPSHPARGKGYRNCSVNWNFAYAYAYRSVNGNVQVTFVGVRSCSEYRNRRRLYPQKSAEDYRQARKQTSAPVFSAMLQGLSGAKRSTPRLPLSPNVRRARRANISTATCRRQPSSSPQCSSRSPVAHRSAA